mmetsp:Transcript_8712/g.20751  ORF Transcript_8712/g.20751 Transcript_8712/m.20751 type:complete len:236 (-) Transcript_8712:235-942(-)
MNASPTVNQPPPDAIARAAFMKNPLQSASRSLALVCLPQLLSSNFASLSWSTSCCRMSLATRRARWCKKFFLHHSGFLSLRSHWSYTDSSVMWSPEGSKKCSWATVAAATMSGFVRGGRYQMLSVDSKATRVTISLDTPRATASNIHFAYGGSSGNCVMRRPSSVMCPSRSTAPNKNSTRNALRMWAVSGFSMKSNLRTSSIPMALSCNTTDSRFTRRISGGVTFWKCFKNVSSA